MSLDIAMLVLAVFVEIFLLFVDLITVAAMEGWWRRELSLAIAVLVLAVGPKRIH